MLPARFSRRPGFTLIELLVVISIIAILLALSASATVRVIDVQRGNNTEQTVKILSDNLDRHWQAVIDKAKNEPIDPQVLSDVRSRGGDDRLARIVYIKLRLRQEFPMDFAEATNVVPGRLRPLPAYQRALAGVTPTGRTSQSSVCLLLALQQARGGISFDPDALGSGAISDAYATGANAAGLKQIVDGWAVPLVFFRWPTGNLELNPDGPAGQAGHNDPTDPEGLLSPPAVRSNQLPFPGFAGWFQNVCHPLPTGGNQPRSFKLIPVVVSQGRNGRHGLNLTTMAVTVPEDANDNIYSHRLRFGARGD